MTRDVIKRLCALADFKPTPAQLDLLTWVSAPVGTMVPTQALKLGPVTNESCFLLGRHSGKSTVAVLSAFFQCMMAPGSQVLVAAKRMANASAVLMKYAREFALRPGIEPYLIERSHETFVSGSTREALQFKNGSELRMVPNNGAAVRSYGPVLLLCDEVSAWGSAHLTDGSSVTEFLAAIRARMVAQHKEKYRILNLTTPLNAAGPVWDWHQDPPPGMTVITATTHEMRPDVKESDFANLRRQEYRREILCEFLSTEDAPIDLELLAECEFADEDIPKPRPGDTVVIGVDQAFRGDFAGFCAAHKRGDLVVVNEVWRRRFKRNVEGFVAALKALTEKYPRARVVIDQFGADSLKALLDREGIHVRIKHWNGQNRDEAFQHLAVLLEDKTIKLPRSKILREEIAGLRQSVLPSGRTKITHGAGHDDATFSLLLATEHLRSRKGYNPDDVDPITGETYREMEKDDIENWLLEPEPQHTEWYKIF